MCFTWFEVIKDENAAGNTIVKEEDFRMLTGNETVSIGSLNFLAQPNQLDISRVAGLSGNSTAVTTSSVVGSGSSSGTGNAASAASASSKAVKGSASSTHSSHFMAAAGAIVLAGVVMFA